MLWINSDRLQEYRQKHQELKASVAEELGLKLLTSGMVDRSETNPVQETGNGNHTEDGGGSEVENAIQTVNEGSEAAVSTNGSSEENQHEDSDRSTSEAVVEAVNGVAEVRPADDAADKPVEVNGKINEALNSPPVLKSKGTWADVVSNSVAANTKGHKDKQVNRVENISASGAAKD